MYNPAVNTYRNRKRVTTVIAHEYAHQWFGDLVSPRSWDFIWLSEGFATLYEYLATRLAEPGDEYWELFSVEVVQRAFLQDANEQIRPINWQAATQAEVSMLCFLFCSLQSRRGPGGVIHAPCGHYASVYDTTHPSVAMADVWFNPVAGHCDEGCCSSSQTNCRIVRNRW